jgi:hypothetical protein
MYPNSQGHEKKSKKWQKVQQSYNGYSHFLCNMQCLFLYKKCWYSPHLKKKKTYQYSLFAARTAENAPCPSIYSFKTTVYIISYTDNIVGIKKQQ